MAMLQQQCPLHADKHVFKYKKNRSFEKRSFPLPPLPFNAHVTATVPPTCRQTFLYKRNRLFEKRSFPFNGHVTATVPSTCRQTCIYYTRGIGHLRKGFSQTDQNTAIQTIYHVVNICYLCTVSWANDDHNLVIHGQA